MAEPVIEISSIAAEGGALGSMILDRNEVENVRAIVRPDDFYLTAHQIICEAIFNIAEKEKGDIDQVRIKNYLSDRGLLDAVGGSEYVLRVVETLPTSANAEYYARIVKEHSSRRRMAAIARDLTAQCMKPEGRDIETIREEAVKALTNTVETISSPFETLESALSGIEFGRAAKYVDTGFFLLDDKISGYGAGQMIVVAGRPGMGKSSFMMCSALNIAEKGKKVLFFSLEMNAQDISLRMACSEAKISTQYAIKGGRWLNEDDKQQLEDSRRRLLKLPIRFDCKSITTERLRSAVISAKRQGFADIVFVDYLGLIKPSNSKVQGRYEITTAISNSLKEISLDADIPLVVGCQLSRLSENRTDKRPMLSDLRDSGAIEQDADIVLFLHRPIYYATTQEEKDNTDNTLCECIVAKNRRGGTGQVGLYFADYCTFFGCPAQEPQQYESQGVFS